MFYTIYQTTNNVNGKKYIGKHVTDNPWDGYIGSGIVLTKAIEKYGRVAFTKEVLFIFDNEADMNNKESELITPDIVMSEEYYNIALGGDGGAIVLKPGHPLYESTCRKISEAQLSRSEEMSRITSENHKLKRVGMYGKTQSDHQRYTASQLMKGRVVSDITIARQKESLIKTFNDPNYTHPNKGKKKQIYSCPHCGKDIGGASNYARYHGDKCRDKLK